MVAKWWLPDEFVFMTGLPKTGTGKLSKSALRESMPTGRVTGVTQSLGSPLT